MYFLFIFCVKPCDSEIVRAVPSHTLTFYADLWKVLLCVIMSLTSVRRVCELGVLSVNSWLLQLWKHHSGAELLPNPCLNPANSTAHLCHCMKGKPFHTAKRLGRITVIVLTLHLATSAFNKCLNQHKIDDSGRTVLVEALQTDPFWGNHQKG